MGYSRQISIFSVFRLGWDGSSYRGWWWDVNRVRLKQGWYSEPVNRLTDEPNSSYLHR